MPCSRSVPVCVCVCAHVRALPDALITLKIKIEVEQRYLTAPRVPLKVRFLTTSTRTIRGASLRRGTAKLKELHFTKRTSLR